MLKNNLFLFKTFLSVSILALILLQVDWAVAARVFQEADAATWGIVVFLLIAQTLVLGVRWYLIVNTSRARISFKEAVQVTLASLVANFIFLTSISGFAVRVFLTIRQGSSIIFALSASIVDRFMTLLALVIMAAILMPLASEHIAREFLIMTASLLATVIISALLLGGLFKNQVKSFAKSNRRIAATFKYVRTIFLEPRIFGIILTTSLVAQLVYFFAVFTVAHAIGIELSFWALLSVLPLIAIIASLPVSIGGWGVREGAFVYGLGLLGVGLEQAFFISVQIGLSGILAAAIVGLPVWLYKTKIYKKEESPDLFDVQKIK